MPPIARCHAAVRPRGRHLAGRCFTFTSTARGADAIIANGATPSAKLFRVMTYDIPLPSKRSARDAVKYRPINRPPPVVDIAVPVRSKSTRPRKGAREVMPGKMHDDTGGALLFSAHGRQPACCRLFLSLLGHASMACGVSVMRSCRAWPCRASFQPGRRRWRAAPPPRWSSVLSSLSPHFSASRHFRRRRSSFLHFASRARRPRLLAPLRILADKPVFMRAAARSASHYAHHTDIMAWRNVISTPECDTAFLRRSLGPDFQAPKALLARARPVRHAFSNTTPF